MKVTITLGDLQDLNSIKGMIESHDEETALLGYSMLENNPIFRIFKRMTFISKPGKEIPVTWFLKKAEEIQKTEEGKKYGQWKGLVLPLIDAIISGSTQFRTSVMIRFDKSLDKTENKNELEDVFKGF